MGLVVLIWLMVATALAGVGIIIVVTNPQLMENARLMIPLFCGVGVLLAIPPSYIIAGKIRGGKRVSA